MMCTLRNVPETAFWKQFMAIIVQWLNSYHMWWTVVWSLQESKQSILSHHFHKKLSTISRNQGVTNVPFVDDFAAK